MLINEIMIWRMGHEYQMHFITLLAIKSKHSFYDIKVHKEQQGQGAQGGGLIIMQNRFPCHVPMLHIQISPFGMMREYRILFVTKWFRIVL